MRATVQGGDGGPNATQVGVTADIPVVGAITPVSVAPTWSATRRFYPLGLGVTPSAFAGNGFTIDILYATPFALGRDATIDQLAMRTSTAAGAGGVARFGIYGCDANLNPTALIVDGGEVTTDVLNTQRTVTVYTPLRAGIYWAAFTSGVANPTMITCNVSGFIGGSIIGFTDGSLSSMVAAGISVARAYAALPAAWPAGSAPLGAGVFPPLVYARFSS